MTNSAIIRACMHHSINTEYHIEYYNDFTQSWEKFHEELYFYGLANALDTYQVYNMAFPDSKIRLITDSGEVIKTIKDY